MDVQTQVERSFRVFRVSRGDGIGMPSLRRKIRRSGIPMPDFPPNPKEPSFLTLSGADREAIISLGTALRLSYLRKRLFLAESKVQHFEEQYGMTLAQLEAEGLPDNADHRLHEDYVMWQHWAEVADKIKPDVVTLEDIERHGLYLGETLDARCWLLSG